MNQRICQLLHEVSSRMSRWLPLACGTGLLWLPLRTAAGTASNQAVTPLPLREAATTRIELPAVTAAGLILHVAPGGDDGGAGTADKPFASLERARDEIRAIRQKEALPRGGVRVLVHGGEYLTAKTFQLTLEDSGKEGALLPLASRV